MGDAAAPPGVTELLRQWNRGDQTALDKLLPVVYDELRSLAAGYLRKERRDHTLQPTALVHEAYLRLVKPSHVTWQSRAHFFGIAARIMRRILVDHARRRRAAKRQGGPFRVTLVLGERNSGERDLDLLELDGALGRLERLDPDQARVVELRFFAGMTVEETAEALSLSPATVKREWRTAKAFLRQEIGAAPTEG